MTNSQQREDAWLDQMGGESLDGSGFETQTTDEAYSNDQSPARFQIANGKECNDVQ